jgi:hypothetical protein
MMKKSGFSHFKFLPSPERWKVGAKAMNLYLHSNPLLFLMMDRDPYTQNLGHSQHLLFLPIKIP